MKKNILNLNLLPQELMVEVFSYLPAESVVKFKCVCKTWRALLDDPYFAELHTGKLPLHYDSLSLLVWAGLPRTAYPNAFRHLYLEDLDYKDDDEQVCKSLSNNLNRPLPPPFQRNDYEYFTIGSCNGLVCLGLGYDRHSPIFVYNPMTREYFILPNDGHEKSNYFWCRYLAQGFGFHPITRKYKIIRLYSYRQSWNPNVQYMKIHTYVLGSGTWRIKKGLLQTPHEYANLHDIGVPFNGSVYWMRQPDGNICSLDLEDEEIRTIPLPPRGPNSKTPSEGRWPMLLVLGGTLCVSEWVRNGIDIWVMKNEKMNNPQVCSWTKKFNIPQRIEIIQRSKVTPYWDTGSFKPLLLTKGGKIICLSSSDKILISFDPKTQSCFLLKEYTKELVFHGRDMITCMKTVVSLKALVGEKDVKMIVSVVAPAAPVEVESHERSSQQQEDDVAASENQDTLFLGPIRQWLKKLVHPFKKLKR